MTTTGNRRDRRRTAAARPRLVVAGALGVAVLGVAWLVTAPDAVASAAAAGSTVGVTADVGEPMYVGSHALADRDVVVESVAPVTVNGLDVALWMCDPASGAVPIGAVGGEALPTLCRSVEPLLPGTTVAGLPAGSRVVDPYVLLEVTPTDDGPQGLCGLDLTYRFADGWRTGRQRAAGPPRVVVNGDDDASWPEEGVLSECDAW